MSIDISQFYDVFFEECVEGLAAMESGLLSLSMGSADAEQINTIFRAAHSIKGGAGTFGFMAISDFTHVMETLLDQMRNGERDATTELTNLLLEAVDVLREMLTAAQQKNDSDESRIAAVRLKLETMLNRQSDSSSESTEPDQVYPDQVYSEQNKVSVWKIFFRPHSHLLQTGNDPVRMFRELDMMGSLTVVADDSLLPPFFDLEPEDSYLSWTLTLEGAVSKQDVFEVFEWVEDDCDLSIELVSSNESSQQDAEIESSPIDQLIQDDLLVNSEPTGDDVTVQNDDSNQASPVVSKPLVQVTTSQPASSIRVGTDKVDSLIDLLGELVITQSMLSQIGDTFTEDMLPHLIDGLAQLERNTREMQEAIMRIRMLPISFVFNRFPRMVHDMTDKTGKQVELKLSGEQTELDKTVMEKIGDPLVHLVRNSLDHGLETPEVRRAAGKNETGLLWLNAFHQGGNIIIEVTDDGAGLNDQKILNKAIERGLVSPDEVLSPQKIHELIFLPGFSTADNVTEVSGRGVGMDVVRKNIVSLGGSVNVASTPGQGSTFTIRLPLTLAIIDGQMIRVADQHYILPLISIVETLEIKNSDIKHVSGKGELYPLRDEYVPIIRLYDVLGLKPKLTNLEEGLLVIVDGAESKVGLFIDDLLGQQQVVIKSLETNYRKVMGISGATILGDGTIALILDVQGLVSLYKDPSLAHVIIADERAA